MKNLPIDDTEDDSLPIDEEDQWQLYASSGYGNSIFVSEENSTENNEIDEEWFDGDDFDTDNQALNWDAPPCPAPLGISHVIKMGICNHCLSRIGGLRNNDYKILYNNFFDTICIKTTKRVKKNNKIIYTRVALDLNCD